MAQLSRMSLLVPVLTADQKRVASRLSVPKVRAKPARPVPRLDTERFPNIHGLRNITESINAWIKKHLSPTGRAGHLHYENQVLDHLLICYLSNAGTARRARLLNLIP